MAAFKNESESKISQFVEEIGTAKLEIELLQQQQENLQNENNKQTVKIIIIIFVSFFFLKL